MWLHQSEFLSKKHDEDGWLWRKPIRTFPFLETVGLVTSHEIGLSAEVLGIFRGEKNIWWPLQKARLNAFTLSFACICCRANVQAKCAIVNNRQQDRIEKATSMPIDADTVSIFHACRDDEQTWGKRPRVLPMSN